MRHFTLLAASAVCIVAPLAGCEDTVTQANYDRIQIGMPLHEVEQIMGGKGELESITGTSISGAGIGSTQTAPPNIYKWQKGMKMITVTVRDGKVIDKGKDRL
jgi:hypothetical protein